MTNDSKAASAITDYPGLLTNSGPSAGGAPPGTASVQINAQVVKVGELTSRPGYKKVRFEGEEDG